MSGTQGVVKEKKINWSEDDSLDVDLDTHKNYYALMQAGGRTSQCWTWDTSQVYMPVVIQK
jgi:hypothetical protein